MGGAGLLYTPKAGSEAGPGMLRIETGSIHMRCQRLANESSEHTLQKRKLDPTVWGVSGREGWVKGSQERYIFTHHHRTSRDTIYCG